METKTNKLNARDFIFIGIFAAVALLIFFIRAEALIPRRRLKLRCEAASGLLIQNCISRSRRYGV